MTMQRRDFITLLGGAAARRRGGVAAGAPRCDCGPHRDAGEMRRVILDLGELPCLIDCQQIESGPLWRGRRRGRSTSRCRITLR
jgi:hypothetical protein